MHRFLTSQDRSRRTPSVSVSLRRRRARVVNTLFARFYHRRKQNIRFFASLGPAQRPSSKSEMPLLGLRPPVDRKVHSLPDPCSEQM
uniref:Uncharacterized protein n=1 Tax=Steinernema glaseri TaxID=37863 RepID=A0A1I7YCT6_9BILA